MKKRPTLYSSTKDPTAWTLRGPATPKVLAAHRAKLEHDFFRSPAHVAVLRAAAKEYDAAIGRESARKKGKKLTALKIPKSNPNKRFAA